MPLIFPEYYGIKIYIYDEHDAPHHTPHLDVHYGEYNAEYDFDGNIVKGKMPTPQDRKIRALIIYHYEELKEAWEKMQTGIKPEKLTPFKTKEDKGE